MRQWVREHPVGFQAAFLGVVFPPLMWLWFTWTGFPRPREAWQLMTLWVLMGALMGGINYVVLRLLRVRIGPPK